MLVKQRIEYIQILADGRSITARSGSSEEYPILEICNLNEKGIEVRYEMFEYIW